MIIVQEILDLFHVSLTWLALASLNKLYIYIFFQGSFL